MSVKTIRKALTVILIFAVYAVNAVSDWLISDFSIPTQIMTTNKGTLRLTNGLILREFILSPDFATVDFYSYEKKSSLLRAVGPEAVVTLDNRKYNISGVSSNIPRAYLNRTALAKNLDKDPSAFHYTGHNVTKPQAPFKYTTKGHCMAAQRSASGCSIQGSCRCTIISQTGSGCCALRDV